jgi:hypothetical protein
MLISMHGVDAMKPAKTAKGTAMSDAIAIARSRVEFLAQPTGWHETKEARRRRVARMVGTTARRIRALLGGEKLTLKADEYLAIERVWESAYASMASISDMARKADVRAREANRSGSGGPARKGGPAGAPARGGPATPAPARGRLTASLPGDDGEGR